MDTESADILGHMDIESVDILGHTDTKSVDILDTRTQKLLTFWTHGHRKC